MDGLSANVEVKRRAYNQNSWGRGYIGPNTLSQQASFSEGSYFSESNEFAARLNYDTKIT